MAEPDPATANSADGEREDVFRAIFLAYPDALLLVDSDAGRIAMANAAAADLLAYTVDELVGMPVDELVPEQIRSRHAAYRQAYGEAPRPRPMGRRTDLMAKRKDGSEVMVEIGLSPLQSHGHPFVVAAIRDIGAYPRVQQALQRARYSEHLAQLGRLAVDTRDLAVLLEHVPGIIATALQVEAAVVYLLDSQGLEFVVVSGVGPLAGEQLGRRVANRPETPAGFMASRGEAVVIPDLRSETRFHVPRGFLDGGTLSAALVPLSDRGRVIGLLAVRSTEADRFDVEELRFLQSLSSLLATSVQRVHSEEALSHSQRLESVGQLTGGIAHDFNNLLTVIQGNLQVLQGWPGLAQDRQAQELVEAATRATLRGAELTGQLLAFSRRQVLQPAAVDIRQLLQSLTGMLLRTFDQRIRIEVEAPADAPCVLADPVQLESALLNIALNARDAMPEGGTLRFHVETCETLPPPLRAEPEAGLGGFVAISVSDTGTGMADGVKERAFEPFFTTKEAGRGTGLGLSTVYGFAHQSRGAITIDSSPGRGTTLSLYLPAMRCAAPTPGDEDARASLPAGLRVLLVEDDVEVRKLVKTFLESLHCEVITAATGRQALAILRAQTRPLGLLLSDIALGAGMRGTRLAAEAQELVAGLPVLLMSGAPLNAPENGAAPKVGEMLRKPFSRADLARAMARTLARARASVQRQGAGREVALHEGGQHLDVRDVHLAAARARKTDHAVARQAAQGTADGLQRHAQVVADFGARHAQRDLVGAQAALGQRAGPVEQEVGHARDRRQRAHGHQRVAVAHQGAAHGRVQRLQQRGTGLAGLQQGGVGQHPDLARVHGHRVRAVVPAGRAVQAQPVAAEVQAHQLLAAVGRQVGDLAQARVEDVQVHKAVTRPVDGVARVDDAARGGEPLLQEIERVGDLPARFRGAMGRAGHGGREGRSDGTVAMAPGGRSEGVLAER